MDLSVVEENGFTWEAGRQLAKSLHAKAKEAAAAASVSVYDLINAAQEWLEKYNTPDSEPEVSQEKSTEQASLWHNMKARGDQPDQSADALAAAPVKAGWTGTDTDAGGLFASIAEDSGNVLPSPWSANQPPMPAAIATKQTHANEPPTDASNRHAAAASKALQPVLSLPTGESIVSTLRSKFSILSRLLLPKPLQRMILPSADAEDGESAAESEDESDTERYRRELMVGHLLLLATGGGAMPGALPPHALPALASHLVTHNLLERHAPKHA